MHNDVVSSHTRATFSLWWSCVLFYQRRRCYSRDLGGTLIIIVGPFIHFIWNSACEGVDFHTWMELRRTDTIACVVLTQTQFHLFLFRWDWDFFFSFTVWCCVDDEQSQVAVLTTNNLHAILFRRRMTSWTNSCLSGRVFWFSLFLESHSVLIVFFRVLSTLNAVGLAAKRSSISSSS